MSSLSSSCTHTGSTYANDVLTAGTPEPSATTTTTDTMRNARRSFYFVFYPPPYPIPVVIVFVFFFSLFRFRYANHVCQPYTTVYEYVSPPPVRMPRGTPSPTGIFQLRNLEFFFRFSFSRWNIRAKRNGEIRQGPSPSMSNTRSTAMVRRGVSRHSRNEYTSTSVPSLKPLFFDHTCPGAETIVQ